LLFLLVDLRAEDFFADLVFFFAGIVCVPPESVKVVRLASATTPRTIESAILRVKEPSGRDRPVFGL
jgi:hypothetical protein